MPLVSGEPYPALLLVGNLPVPAVILRFRRLGRAQGAHGELTRVSPFSFLTGAGAGPEAGGEGSVRASTVGRSAMFPLVAVLLWMLSGTGCRPEVMQTSVLLVVDSNLEVGTQLTELRVRVFDESGERERGSVEFPLTAERDEPGRYTLPLSMSVAAKEQSSTRKLCRHPVHVDKPLRGQRSNLRPAHRTV